MEGRIMKILRLAILCAIVIPLHGMEYNPAAYEMAEKLSYVIKEYKDGFANIVVCLQSLCMNDFQRNVRQIYAQYGRKQPYL